MKVNRRARGTSTPSAGFRKPALFKDNRKRLCTPRMRALSDEAEQDVLSADVVVSELKGLSQRELEDVLGAGRERNVAPCRRLRVAGDHLHLEAGLVERDPHRRERPTGHAFAFGDQPKQEVFGPD